MKKEDLKKLCDDNGWKYSKNEKRSCFVKVVKSRGGSRIVCGNS